MKKFNLDMTCKALYNTMEKGLIDFDCAVQRGKVWDLDKKSLLIHSLLYNYSVPPFYLTKNDDDTYDSLDGKQRSNAIHDFISGDYSLNAEFPVVYDDEGEECDFSGASFEALPEWAQDRIKDYNLTVYYYEDMTEAEVREFFRRLNNGKPLTAVELTRVKAVSITEFQDLAKHTAIDFVTSDKGKASFKDENIAMQIYGLKYMENVDFGTKMFRPFITEAVVTDEQKNSIIKGLDMLWNLLYSCDKNASKESKRVLRKLKSRTHFVCSAYLGTLCNEYGISQQEYNVTLYNFFKTTTTSSSDDYNSTVGGGSARAAAVQKRKKVIDALFDTMLENSKDDEEDNSTEE